MGFFEVPDADDGDLEPDPPFDIPQTGAWTAGVVPLELVVARSDDAAVVASRIAAYPDGFELTLDSFLHRSAQARRRRRRRPVLLSPHELAPGGPVPDEFLKFGITWPDGGRATNLDWFGRLWSGADPDAPLPTHVLEVGGGGGSEFDFTQHYWCRPLPTEGTLTIVVEWPAFGIPETSATVDAAVLVEAAARARPVWEEDAHLPHRLDRATVMRAMSAATPPPPPRTPSPTPRSDESPARRTTPTT